MIKIEIKDTGIIHLTTQSNMVEMDRGELEEIEKAIKAVRYLVDQMNVRNLTLEIH